MENKDDILERRSATKIDFASLGKMIVTDLKSPNSTRMQKTIAKHSKEDFLRFSADQERFQKQLREISNFLYNRSAHYKRLIDYFATLPTYAYLIEPTGIDRKKVNKSKLLTQYNKVMNALDKMNITHEFIKVMKSAFREDVFYGYIHETNDSFFIQRLDADYCRISSVEDGCNNIAFDFSYFDAYKDKLPFFHPDFERLYAQATRTTPWIELDSQKTICIKINEDFLYPVLPFMGVFDSIYDIQDYKALRKARAEIGNYKVLVQRLPIRQDSDQNNDFLIDFNNMMVFHNKIAEALPQNVALLTSPMEIKEVSFQRDTVDQDHVAQSERDFWSASGVSQLLFNAEKAGSIGLDKSIVTDEIVIFSVLRQLERWINRKLKFQLGNAFFKVRFLDMTELNRDDIYTRAIEAGQYGIPVQHIIGATFGYSPSAFANMAWLETELLDIQADYQPMQSSHTQNGTTPPANPSAKKGGRPSQGDNIGDEALRTRDKKPSSK